MRVVFEIGMVPQVFHSEPPRTWVAGENLFLRHQLAIALRRAPARLRLGGSDRALWPSLLGAARVVQPETILRWHRAASKADLSLLRRV
jgi:hypothetical protein